MHPIPWPVLDTGLYAFHGTLREEVFQILQLSGVCGHGLEPCTLSTQLILPRSTTQITSVYQFATAHHALIDVPDIYFGNISAQRAKLFTLYRFTLRFRYCVVHGETGIQYPSCLYIPRSVERSPIFCLQGLCRSF